MKESVLIIIRSMMEDPLESGQPLVLRGKAATLGVRKRDITPDSDGLVHPHIHEGMSAYILPESNIHHHFRPKKFGGTSDDPLWFIDDSVLLGFELKFELDDPKATHGVIKTTRTMPHDEYVENLEATQSLWKER